MIYKYKAYMPINEIVDYIGERKFISVLGSLLVFNEKMTSVEHIYPAEPFNISNYPFLNNKKNFITLEDVAKAMEVEFEDLDQYIKNWKEKKLAKGFQFDLKGLKNTVKSKKNKDIVRAKRAAVEKELIDYFGSEEKYKEFLDHTLFASFRVNIIMNPLYEYDGWSNPFDMVSVEIPVYPRKWHDEDNEHKKQLYRYALIRLSYYTDYIKFDIPVKNLKLHSVSWDHEFISFHLVIKDQ